MSGRLRRFYYVGAYYLSWLVFGLVGVTLNFCCLLLLVFPRRAGLAAKTRRVIRRLFDWWLRWLHMTGVVQVCWHGFEGVVLSGRTVYVANHPTLVDAPFLLARLPDAICIFKPALMRNPAIGPAAIMADYPCGISGVDVVRDAAAQLKNGCSLLIFPEGTRTARDRVLGTFKPGFALIAERAGVPVRAITIRSTGELCTRERPWWRAPSVLPSKIDIALGPEWLPDPNRRPLELTAEVQRQIEIILSEPSA